MLTKIKIVIVDQLKMGATPEKMAQSTVAGMLIGVFPLIGLTTLLAGMVAFLFKLNHLVTQSVNYFMYPVQIIMIPIYIKIVSLIFDVGYVPLRPDLIIKQFNASPMDFLRMYGLIGIYAVILWCILSTILYFILYPLILKAVLKFKKGRKNGVV